MLYLKFCCQFLGSSLCFSSYIKLNSSVSISQKYHQYFIFMKPVIPHPSQWLHCTTEATTAQLRFDRQKRNMVTVKSSVIREAIGLKSREICSLIETHLIYSLSAEAYKTGYFTTQLLHVHSINEKNLICFQQRKGWGRNECSVPCLINTTFVCHR